MLDVPVAKALHREWLPCLLSCMHSAAVSPLFEDAFTRVHTKRVVTQVGHICKTSDEH
jgi:hypothetical protein